MADPPALIWSSLPPHLGFMKIMKIRWQENLIGIYYQNQGCSQSEHFFVLALVQTVCHRSPRWANSVLACEGFNLLFLCLLLTKLSVSLVKPFIKCCIFLGTKRTEKYQHNFSIVCLKCSFNFNFNFVTSWDCQNVCDLTCEHGPPFKWQTKLLRLSFLVHSKDFHLENKSRRADHVVYSDLGCDQRLWKREGLRDCLRSKWIRIALVHVEHLNKKNSEVIFVTAVTAGGSVNFLPVV